MVDAVVRPTGGWEGKRVLEIGPGDSLGAGLLALAEGAVFYRAIDRFPVTYDPAVERRVFLKLLEPLPPEKRARAEAVVEIRADDYRICDDRFAYFNDLSIEQATRRFPPESFDVIYSNAVLEHVASVQTTFENVNKLLAPGGVMFHQVDFRSHQRFEKHPLHFLTYPRFLWRAMTSHTGEPNRVRPPAYKATLNDLGFEDVTWEVIERFDTELIRTVCPTLAPEYRSLPEKDLAWALVRLSARKPTSI